MNTLTDRVITEGNAASCYLATGFTQAKAEHAVNTSNSMVQTRIELGDRTGLNHFIQFHRRNPSLSVPFQVDQLKT